ncbi:hypothetical protein C2S52_007311 [Perilla frutescens var. hirtella]|nr:hypothetical protein C2S52_007311 [Perilla frutescens var. hirtella]
MVCFRDVTDSGNTYLMIMDYERQPAEKGTRLKVHISLIGSFAPNWPQFTNYLRRTTWTREVPLVKASSTWILESSHHRLTSQPSLLPTLGRRIVEEGATWGDNVDFVGEFHYFYGYLEWTEDILSRCENELHRVGIFDSVYASLFTYDRNTEIMKAFCEAWCPSTNTLLTLSGELSISLWDLHVLSGLPVYGAFYDEIVPCTEELMVTNREGDLHIPASCSSLIHAYHIIRAKVGSVTIENWIKFWSKNQPVYQRPPPRKERKTAPQSTYNPTGDLKAYKPWTGIETVSFVRLGIKEKRWKEAYLAAHIACWLCCFVLPDGDGNLIQPDTFKMASMMANGKKVSLTIPVLTSIYRGEGGAREDYVKSFVDDDAASESEQCFFMAIRSNYLIRRLSKRFVVEPYSPHRFSRQFGFYQIMPRVLAQDIREALLDDGFKYWRICMRRHSKLKVCFPNLIVSAKRFLSSGYKSWWDQTYRSFLEEKIMTLILHKTDEVSKSKKKNISPPKNNTPEGKKKVEAVNPPKDNTSKGKKKVEELEREIFGDDLEDLRNNYETVDFDRLFEPQSDELIKAKPVPHLEAISEFNVKALFDKHRKSYLQNCWSELRNKVLRTPPEFMSSIQEEVLGGFSQMKAFSGDFDMSFLEKSLGELFTTAAAYDEGFLPNVLRRLDVASNVETRSNEEIGQIQSIEKELADLEERHKDLCISLKEYQISHNDNQKKIKGFEEEHANLKNVSEK